MASGKYSVLLKKIVEEHELNVIHAASDYETAKIYNHDVARPGLQFAGFYDYFNPDQIQVMGKVETSYLKKLDEEARENAINTLFEHKIAALVICHRVPPDPLLVNAAHKYDINLLSTDVDTSEFMAQLIGTLRSHLAPRMTVHAVLVEVHGEGLLIMGDSGVGKSETALELVKRGHRLVADDAVEIRRMSRNTVTGSAPKMIRYMMELRGIGIVDIRQIYGVGSVLPVGKIDLVVNFERWEEGKFYERLGIDTEYTSFMGVRVPKITIPVGPGRNLAVLLELAAMNHRQHKMGYNAASALAKQHDELTDMGWQSL